MKIYISPITGYPCKPGYPRGVKYYRGAEVDELIHIIHEMAAVTTEISNRGLTVRRKIEILKLMKEANISITKIEGKYGR